MEGAMKQWVNPRLFDAANLILGAVLFLSPWIFRIPTGAESENAYFSGAIIAFISLVVLAEFEIWEEWLNLMAGVWVMTSPWVLGFHGTKAATVDVVIGISVTLLAAIELWFMYHNPPRLSANH
jgi:SPW repeat